MAVRLVGEQTTVSVLKDESDYLTEYFFWGDGYRCKKKFSNSSQEVSKR